MGQQIVQIDAFSDRAFRGNPAAVCLLAEPADPDWMQAVASEMNLSETAFLHRESDGYRLRWFTPGAEVDLCGHATLAAAHYLWEEGRLGRGEEVVFHTRSGRLSARCVDDWIELDFPADPATPRDVPARAAVALGAKLSFYALTGLYGLFEVESEAVLRSLTPNYALVRELHPVGIAVTARSSSPEYDFVSRFFAPAVGIDEDPVTGSAHCSLGPLWGERLNKNEMTAFQASPRGGVVKIRLVGERVLLSGRAVTVLRGELLGSPSPRDASAG